MGLISSGGQNLLDFLELRQALSTYHRAVPRTTVSESILGLKVEAVKGKHVSLEWTETSGGLWECRLILEFLSPFLWRAPPLEMRRELREFFPDHAGKGSVLSS